MRKHQDQVLVQESPDSNLQACVILPARNEEDLLPSALQSLAEQKTLNGEPLPYQHYEVILLVNNSTDRTPEIARSFQRLYSSFRLHVVNRNFEKSHAHIGHVRRLLMDEACRRLEGLDRFEGLILSTDSDTRVAPNWICRNSAEITQGADVIGGRIVVLPCEQELIDTTTQEIYRYDHLYRRLLCWLEDRCDPQLHDPWPRHHQHFGASLAITPRAYRLARRMPPRRYLEDMAFYEALIRRDIRIRHSNLVRVFTSGRLNGRTRFGLSRQLKDWQASRRRLRSFRVESVPFLESLFDTRRRLRCLWLGSRKTRRAGNLEAAEVATRLGIPVECLLEEARSAAYFGLLITEIRFYERFRRMWPEGVRLARIEKVVEELRTAFKADRRAYGRTAHRECSLTFV
jgi:hypothetical protein